jgi:uroporphyrinogen-III synthase
VTRPPPRILVTRSPHQASALADSLRALGADPVLIPAIDIVDSKSFAPLHAALAHLDSFHWLLFTSANAVGAFHRRASLSGPWALSPGTCRIAAIGPATARALEAIGLTSDLMPPQAVAESLAEALLPHARQTDGSPTRFLLIRAEEAREHLPEALLAAGAEVTIAPAYRTVIPAGSIDAIGELFARPENYPDAITFTSSSTARNLFALLEAAGITLPGGEKSVIASMGPITSATLRDLGYPPDMEATDASVEALAEELVGFLRSREREGG